MILILGKKKFIIRTILENSFNEINIYFDLFFFTNKIYEPDIIKESAKEKISLTLYITT